MVLGDVEPGGFAIDDKYIFLRRFVFPTHLARPLEVGFASLYANHLPILRVAFQECSLEACSTSVSLLKPPQDLRNGCLAGRVT